MEQLTYFTILRLLHISCGVFWAGATIYLACFIIPAAKAAGPEGSKFMQQLGKTNKLPLVMVLVSSITVISGSILIWKLSGGLQTEWLRTKYGMVLTAGGGFAILAFLIGFFRIRPNVDRMGKIGQQITMAGGPPTAAQVQEIGNIQKTLAVTTQLVAALLAVTVIAMSIVRYL